MADLTEYDPDNPKGWVVRSEADYPRKDGGTRTHVSWWFGPDHGFGNTWGSLWLDRERWPHTLEVAVWPTKKAATEARRALGRRKGVTIQRLADAIKEATP